MREPNKDKFILFLIGIIAGVLTTVIGGIVFYKMIKHGNGNSPTPVRYEAKKEDEKIPDEKKRYVLKDFFLSFEDKKDLDVFQVEGNVSAELSKSYATHGRRSLLVKIEPSSKFPGLVW